MHDQTNNIIRAHKTLFISHILKLLIQIINLKICKHCANKVEILLFSSSLVPLNCFMSSDDIYLIIHNFLS